MSDRADAQVSRIDELIHRLGLEEYDEYEDALWCSMSDFGEIDLDDLVDAIAAHFGVDEANVWDQVRSIHQAAADCDAERHHERSQLYGGMY